jgi:hypothetical protein
MISELQKPLYKNGDLVVIAVYREAELVTVDYPLFKNNYGEGNYYYHFKEYGKLLMYPESSIKLYKPLEKRRWWVRGYYHIKNHIIAEMRNRK